MQQLDNVIGVLDIVAIAIVAMFLLKDAGTEIALTAVGAISGYITKGVVDAVKGKTKDPSDVSRGESGI